MLIQVPGDNHHMLTVLIPTMATATLNLPKLKNKKKKKDKPS